MIHAIHKKVHLYINNLLSFAWLSLWPGIQLQQISLYLFLSLYCFPPVSFSVSLSLSDMLMLLIPIGNKTEPSAYKKTMLAAAHRFLPGALKGVLQTIGVQGVLTISCFTDCIDSLLWALPNSLLLSKRTANCSVWA